MIRQCGVVESVDGKRLRIRTVRSSACDACGAASGCNAHGAKPFYVDADSATLASCRPGDHVEIEMTPRLGRQAVGVGFLIPLLVFVAVLAAVRSSVADDGIAALSALGALVAYYIILYMLRSRVNRHFTVRITKITE